MIYETVLPVWNALRDRFQDKVKGLTDEDLKMKVGDKTLGSILHHTGEAEYIFAEWVFQKKQRTCRSQLSIILKKLLAF